MKERSHPWDSKAILAGDGESDLKPNSDAAACGERLESVDLLDGGAQAYPRMLLSIGAAQRTVHLEVYSFAASGVGARFVEALGQASGRGVKVHVLIDGWGSGRGGRVVAEALRHAGCEVQIQSRLASLLVGRFARNHRKILLVDDRLAFIGGINIGDENLDMGSRLGWADLALEIRGLPSVRLGEMIRGEPQGPFNSSLRIYLSGFGGGWRLRRRYLKAFASACQRIELAHGYFLPAPRVIRALASAARRGVQVRLLIAGQSDVPFTRVVTRSLSRRLLASGVRIHEWSDSVLHAKLATIDGRCLLIGSFNLDPFSLTNQEVLVEVTDTRVVNQGEMWIQDHFARSLAMPSVESGSPWQRWLLDPLGRGLARLLDTTSRIIVGRRRRRHVRRSTFAEVSALRLARRASAGVIGLSVLGLVGVLIALPDLAFVVVPLGLATLIAEFVGARRLLRSLRARGRSRGQS